MNKEKLSKSIKRDTKNFMNIPISESLMSLEEIIKKITPEDGQTALGPSLLAANILIDDKDLGSQVVVLTDGGANYGIGTLQEAEGGRVDDQFYVIIAKEFKVKGTFVSIFTFGDAACKLSDLTILSKETQGVMGRYEIPLETPILTLPAYVKEISNIKITIFSDPSIRVKSIYEMDSDPKQTDNILVNERKVMLMNSIFCFECPLKNRTARKPHRRFPIQVQIDYCKGKKYYRRTATDYIYMEDKPSIKEFTEYDVLIKYGAKSATYILRKSCSVEKNLARETLVNMISMLKSSRIKNLKKNECIERLKAHLEAIENNQKDDKRVSHMIEEATVDYYTVTI